MSQSVFHFFLSFVCLFVWLVGWLVGCWLVGWLVVLLLAFPLNLCPFISAAPFSFLVLFVLFFQSLRAYLLSYASGYTTISLSTLSSMFELSPNIVHSLVSRMMADDSLDSSLQMQARWDPAVLLHRHEPGCCGGNGFTKTSIEIYG